MASCQQGNITVCMYDMNLLGQNVVAAESKFEVKLVVVMFDGQWKVHDIFSTIRRYNSSHHWVVSDQLFITF